MRGYLLGMLTYAALFVPASTWRERYEYPRDLICSWWLLRQLPPPSVIRARNAEEVMPYVSSR